jgi:hypothetical protein
MAAATLEEIQDGSVRPIAALWKKQIELSGVEPGLGRVVVSGTEAPHLFNDEYGVEWISGGVERRHGRTPGRARRRE